MFAEKMSDSEWQEQCKGKETEWQAQREKVHVPCFGVVEVCVRTWGEVKEDLKEEIEDGGMDTFMTGDNPNVWLVHKGNEIYTNSGDGFPDAASAARFAWRLYWMEDAPDSEVQAMLEQHPRKGIVVG